MRMAAEKMRFLERLLGKARAAQIVESLSVKQAELEEAGWKGVGRQVPEVQALAAAIAHIAGSDRVPVDQKAPLLRPLVQQFDERLADMGSKEVQPAAAPYAGLLFSRPSEQAVKAGVKELEGRDRCIGPYLGDVLRLFTSRLPQG